MKNRRFEKIGFEILRFLIFFAAIAFILTSSFLLFFWSMEFDRETIQTGARLTFFNAVFIAFLFWLLNFIQRKITVERPIKKITDGLDKITKGDFSQQLQPVSEFMDKSGFNIIIDRINTMTAELGNVETLRTDFISNVSHELKTPLAVMQNYGTMLQQPDLSERKRIEYAKSITNACRRLSSLVTNILKLNKLENQQIFSTAKEYDLSEQICECLLQFEDIWERKNIDITAEIEEQIFINSDSELLEIVWNNLLSNAFKFTPNGGRVSVHLTTEKQYAVIRISDTGCGISQEVGRHIFEKFYQGDTSHATQGNGLGLALVKRIMEITGGNISVESEEGKGSVFTVKIGCGQNEEIPENFA